MCLVWIYAASDKGFSYWIPCQRLAEGVVGVLWFDYRIKDGCFCSTEDVLTLPARS